MTSDIRRRSREIATDLIDMFKINLNPAILAPHIENAMLEGAILNTEAATRRMKEGV